VRYVSTSTPDNDHGPCDIAIKTISDHDSLMNKADIREFLNETGGLAVAVLVLNAKIRPRSGSLYWLTRDLSLKSEGSACSMTVIRKLWYFDGEEYILMQ